MPTDSHHQCQPEIEVCLSRHCNLTPRRLVCKSGQPGELAEARPTAPFARGFIHLDVSVHHYEDPRVSEAVRPVLAIRSLVTLQRWIGEAAKAAARSALPRVRFAAALGAAFVAGLSFLPRL